jgi:hypothetical protein
MIRSAKAAVRLSKSRSQSPIKRKTKEEVSKSTDTLVDQAFKHSFYPPTKRIKPTEDIHQFNKHLTTPTKAKIKGTIDFLEAKGIRKAMSLTSSTLPIVRDIES